MVIIEILTRYYSLTLINTPWVYNLCCLWIPIRNNNYKGGGDGGDGKSEARDYGVKYWGGVHLPAQEESDKVWSENLSVL